MTASAQTDLDVATASPLLIGDLLRSGLSRAPDQEIVYAGGVRLTYRRLAERIQRLAALLDQAGAGAGTTVAVMEWDSHRYLECYFAIPMLGAVLHTVNIRLSPEQLLYTINHAADAIMLCNADFLPLLAAVLPRVEAPLKLIVLQDDDAQRPALPDQAEYLGEYEALLAQAAPEFRFPALTEDTRATTFYTTGTTGLPKGVYYSHRQLVLHSLALASTLLGSGQGHITQADVYMPLTPMFHVHAWGLPYLATSLGMKQVYPGHYRPAVIVRLLQSEGVTFSHCVPTVLQMVLTAAEARSANFENWIVVIGGSALSQALTEQARAVGIDIFGGYGMSETCPVLTLAQLRAAHTTLPRDQENEVRRLAGKPIPLVSLRVVDEHMQDVPRDGHSQGEIVVRAPWLTAGYLHDPQSSARLWQAGWLHTGDVGYLNAEGYLKITDRLKDVIKSGGEWISSLEIEDLLVRHPEVQEAAVFGVPDERWGERPVALVVVNDPARVQPEALIAYLKTFVERGQLSRYGILSKLHFVAELPKTSVGKLNKKALREAYLEDRPARPKGL